jgi:hypothetical protein
MSLKNPVIPPAIDPGNVRLIAQPLNHCATPRTASIGSNFRTDHPKCNIKMLNIRNHNLEPELCSRYSASGMGWRVRSSSPERSRDFSLQIIVQTDYETDPPSCSLGNGVYFVEGKADGVDAESLSPSSTKVKSKWIYTGCFSRKSKYFRMWQYGLFRVNKFI